MSLPLAFLVVAVWVVARDIGELGLGAVATLVGAVCLVACGGSALDLVSRGVERRVPRRWVRWTLLLVVSLAPVAFALLRYVEVADTLSWRTPVSVTLFGALAFAAAFWSSRRADDAALVLGTVWALVGLGLLLYVHRETDTLYSVREGTEPLHLGLYLGTWSVLLPVALVAGVRAQTHGMPAWSTRLVAGGAVLLGGLLLELDRRLFVDLYTAVHLWLGVMGVLFSALGVAASLPKRLCEGAQRRAVRLAPLYGVAVCAVSFTLFVPGSGSARLRTQLAESPLGATLLELLPAEERGAQRQAAHPALAYPRHLDAAPLPKQPNILLVTVDALRADALHEMPEVSRIATEASVFTRAYAQGARTAIGVGTLMTGLYSAHMDWRLWIYSKGKISEYSELSAQERQAARQRFVFTTVPQVPRGNLLAERLNDSGYATLAVPFGGKNEFFRGDLVFARGFDRFVDLTQKKWKPPSSARVVDRALEELPKVKKRPWFLWVHLYDPHESARSKEKYERYVRITDGEVGRLVRAIEDRGEWQDTVFVLLSDHGEAFGEHRHQGHATSLYDEQVRVPFVLRVPGLGPQRIEEPVAMIDATATLAVMAGAKTNDLDGVNLLPRLRGEVGATPRPVFTELHRYLSSQAERTTDLKAVIWGDHKLISNRRRKTQELFDLRQDPAEEHNLVGSAPDKHRELAELLDSFLRNAEAQHPLP